MFLFRLDTLAVVLILVAIVLGATALGHLVGRSEHDKPEGNSEPFGLMQAAMLGFMGLVLAFGLGLAFRRYEDRRAAIVGESDALGTTYLRAQQEGRQRQHGGRHEDAAGCRVTTPSSGSRPAPRTTRTSSSRAGRPPAPSSRTTPSGSSRCCPRARGTRTSARSRAYLQLPSIRGYLLVETASRTIQLRTPAEVGWHIRYFHQGDLIDVDGVQLDVTARYDRLDRLAPPATSSA